MMIFIAGWIIIGCAEEEQEFHDPFFYKDGFWKGAFYSNTSQDSSVVGYIYQQIFIFTDFSRDITYRGIANKSFMNDKSPFLNDKSPFLASYYKYYADRRIHGTIDGLANSEVNISGSYDDEDGDYGRVVLDFDHSSEAKNFQASDLAGSWIIYHSACHPARLVITTEGLIDPSSRVSGCDVSGDINKPLYGVTAFEVNYSNCIQSSSCKRTARNGQGYLLLNKIENTLFLGSFYTDELGVPYPAHVYKLR